MSLRNYYDTTKNEMHFQQSEIDMLTISNGTKTIKHFIDSSHNYCITDESDNLIMKCDSNSNVLPCSLSLYSDTKINTLNSSISSTTTSLNAVNAIVSSLQATIAGLSAGNPIYSVYEGRCASVGDNLITNYNVTNTGFIEGSIFSTISMIHFKVFFTIGGGLCSIINMYKDGFISSGENVVFTTEGTLIKIVFVSSVSNEHYFLQFLPVICSTF